MTCEPVVVDLDSFVKIHDSHEIYDSHELFSHVAGMAGCLYLGDSVCLSSLDYVMFIA